MNKHFFFLVGGVTSRRGRLVSRQRRGTTSAAASPLPYVAGAHLDQRSNTPKLTLTPQEKINIKRKQTHHHNAPQEHRNEKKNTPFPNHNNNNNQKPCHPETYPKQPPNTNPKPHTPEIHPFESTPHETARSNQKQGVVWCYPRHSHSHTPLRCISNQCSAVYGCRAAPPPPAPPAPLSTGEKGAKGAVHEGRMVWYGRGSTFFLDIFFSS